jgi:GT2 family glycosyltransferase
MRTVTILCPIAESISAPVFQSALALINYSVLNNIRIDFIGVTERTLIDTARNTLAKEFLKTPSDWAFWMDADMVLPKETIVKLLDVADDKKTKMVSGVYYQRGRKHWPVLWSRSPILEKGDVPKVINKDEYDQNGYIGMFTVPGPDAKDPFKVHSSGMGCALIHRNVFESLEFPWFRFLYKKCSEDFYFFVNAGKKGFQLWADPSLHIGHVGEPKIVYKEDCYETMKSNDTNLEAIKKEELVAV